MTLRDKLADGHSVFGGFVFSSDPAMGEIYADAGFDFVVIDLEHATNDIRTALQHLRACESRGISALARIGSSTETDIPRLLDAGFAGIMMPHFGMAGTGAASSLRYPPMGSRPTCTGIRAASFGLQQFSAYAERSNREVLGIGLIEDLEVLPGLKEMLAEGIVDCVMPGPADLATSMGVHGDFKHPDVTAAVDEIFQSAGAADTIAAMYVSTPSEIPAWYAKGARLFVLSIDYKLIGASLGSARQACREAVENSDKSAAGLYPHPAT